MKDLARQLAGANGVAATGCYTVTVIALVAALGPAAGFVAALLLLAVDMALVARRRRARP